MKKISKLIIPLALLVLWGFLTLSYVFDYSPSLSVISYPHNKENFINFNTNRLYDGQKIIGEFTADENYLGIVTVSFATFGSKVAYLSEDNLVFRIKQSGVKDWYYEQTYKSGLMYDVPLYPFGFPKINDSKGKKYVFEIESLHGNDLNAVALDMWEPVLITRYQPPKNEISQDKDKFINFFGRKIFVAFGSMDVLFFSFVYFLPFLFYILLFVYPFKKIVVPFLNALFRKPFWLIGKLFKKIITPLKSLPIVKRFIQTSTFRLLDKIFKSLGHLGVHIKDSLKRYLDLFLVAIVLIDIFFIPVVNDIAFIVVIVLWTVLAKRYKYTSKESFIVGFIFLVLCPLILLFELDNIAEKSGAWAYMFFVAGVVQILKENRSSKSHEEN